MRSACISSLYLHTKLDYDKEESICREIDKLQNRIYASICFWR